MKFDMVPKFLQSTNEPFLGMLAISLIKIVASEFFIALVLA